MRKSIFLNQKYCIHKKNRYNVLMKHVISIKQKNLKTGEEHLLCDQICDLTKNQKDYSFSYHELKPFDGKVEIKGNEKGCTIFRNAENKSTLHFMEKKKTKGMIESVYGIFEVDLFTRHYILKDEIIALEYDVLNQDEVLESYRMMVKIKKVV